MTKRIFVLAHETARRTVEINSKMAQCIRLAGPMHHFPHHCHERTSGMSNFNSTIKFCVKCQTDTERRKDGRCTPCDKKTKAIFHEANKDRRNAISSMWRAGNQEKKREDAASYYRINSDSIKESSKAWRESNPEKAQETAKNYRLENKEERNKASVIWREANPEKVKKNFADWYAANPELNRIKAQNRRSRKLKNGGVISNGLAIKLFKLQKGKCACCGEQLGGRYHLDHKMPLALGGSNTDDNMQLLLPRCNLQKNAKHPVDFMQERGFLL